MLDRGLGVLPQPPAQICCRASMTLFMRIGAAKLGNWPYNFQSTMEVQWQLLTFWDIRRYAQDGFLKVSQLSRRQRKAICSELSERFDAEGWPFVPDRHRCLNLGSHYEPEMKRQSMEWRHPQSRRKNMFKTTSSAGKVIISIFWDTDGVILVDVVARGETINSDAYIKTLLKLEQR
jgi:hypothetical protein